MTFVVVALKMRWLDLTQTVSHVLNYRGTAKYGLTRQSGLLENIY